MNYGPWREGRVRERGVALTKRFASCYLRHVEWRVALEIVGRLNETRKDILSLPFQKNLQYLEEEEKKRKTIRKIRDREISNDPSNDKLEIKKKRLEEILERVFQLDLIDENSPFRIQPR